MKIAELSFLVVEDNAFQLQTLIEMLERLEAKRVHSAPDGQKALDLLARLEEPVDVIISDLEMPTMDGMELIRHVGASGYRNSLIIASALAPTLLAAVETMTKAYGINLLGVLHKPVTPRSLEGLLARYAPAVPQPRRPRAASLVFTLDEIMHGLEQNEFEAFFQPKIDLASRRIIGAEALARWRHPQQGVVPPSAFIQVLEDAGKVDDLLWVMLRRSAAFCGELSSLKSSVELAKRLKIASVAEGVETQQEWNLVEELGCDLAQGYFIAKPMPPEAYLDWLADLSSDAMTIAIA